MLRNRVFDLEKVTKTQGDIIESYERHFRRNNIIINGLDENLIESERNKLKNCIMNSSQVELNINIDCESISRFGKVSQNKSLILHLRPPARPITTSASPIKRVLLTARLLKSLDLATLRSSTSELQCGRSLLLNSCHGGPPR